MRQKNRIYIFFWCCYSSILFQVKPPNTNDIFNNQHNEVSCHPQETRALGKCNSFPLPKRNLLQVPLSTLDSPWYGSETSLESDTSFESGSSGSKLYDHNAAIRRDVSFVKKHCTKNEVFIYDFFSKCDQIRRKLLIWWHLLKKSLMKNFIFCDVKYKAEIWTFCRISGG